MSDQLLNVSNIQRASLDDLILSWQKKTHGVAIDLRGGGEALINKYIESRESPKDLVFSWKDFVVITNLADIDVATMTGAAFFSAFGTDRYAVKILGEVSRKDKYARGLTAIGNHQIIGRKLGEVQWMGMKYDDSRIPVADLDKNTLHDIRNLYTKIPWALTYMLSEVKNLELVPEPPKNRAERKRIARGEGGFVKSVIVIKVGGKMKRVTLPKNGSKELGKRRLHGVTGHFADYTDAAPLFGKLTGTFWIPYHLRGTAEAGESLQTYMVSE